MRVLDQDFENRIKNLAGEELDALIDFVLPNHRIDVGELPAAAADSDENDAKHH